MTTRTTGVVLLVLLLAGFLLLGALPNHAADVRVAGLSLLWWYGGVLAPVLAALVALRCLAEPLPASRPEERPGRPAERRGRPAERRGRPAQ